MPLTTGLIVLLIALLALGVWGVMSAIRVGRRSTRPPIAAPQLSGLAQPYRGILGEMLEVWHAVVKAIAPAPASLERELSELSTRLGRVVARALPRAEYGTRLVGYRDDLPQGDPQRIATSAAAQDVADELRKYLGTLRSVQRKVYQLLTDATAMQADDRLHTDLEDALIDVESLEEAFREVLDEKL